MRTTNLLTTSVALTRVNLGAALAVLLIAGVAFAADIWVVAGGPNPTIQSGINQAVAGDTVYVYAGTYNEKVVINSSKNSIRLKAYNGEVIIDGTGLGSGATGLFIDGSNWIEIDGTAGPFTVRDFTNRGLVIRNGTNCFLFDCHFINNTNGGARIKGQPNSVTTDNIDFVRCWFNDNDGNGFADGLEINPEDLGDPGWNGPVITNITLTDCHAKRNGRSGFRCQETETLRIYDGYYDANDAAGIQIEQETRDVIIDGARADNNSVPSTGEAGFWIDEAKDVTLKWCVASNNHFGIAVSQSDRVTIDNCDILDAKQPLGGAWGGLKVNTGNNHSLTADPFGGVRTLRVKNCEFWNGNAVGNNKGDIYYGDTEGPTPYAEMEFYDNKVHTNCKCDGVPIDPNDKDDYFYFEFDPEDSNHEPLSFEVF